MARIATDPNYNSPTFPRATAGTDLFLKEDLQALAAAVSTHVHDGAGKGLQVTSVPLTAIPDGSITSAKIADGTIVAGDIADGAVTSAKILDGTIATADIAANAVQQQLAGYTGVPGFSTTVVSSWVATAVSSGSVACTGALLRIEATITLSHTVVAGSAFFGLMIDGAIFANLGGLHVGGNGWQVPCAFVFYTVPSGGNHTFTLAVQNNAVGTLSSAGVATLYVTEQKK